MMRQHHVAGRTRHTVPQAAERGAKGAKVRMCCMTSAHTGSIGLKSDKYGGARFRLAATVLLTRTWPAAALADAQLDG
jgi:anti-sigma factor RsiW